MSKTSESNWTKIDKKIATACVVLEIGSINWDCTSKIKQKTGNYCDQGRSINHNDQLDILNELRNEGLISQQIEERGKLPPAQLWRVSDMSILKKYVKDVIENPLMKACLNISLKKVREVL